MKPTFNYKEIHDGLLIFLEDESHSILDYFKDKQANIIKTNEWLEDENIKGLSGILKLLSLIDEGSAMLHKEEPNGYVISHHEIAKLSQQEAKSFGLPVDVPLMLGVQAEGNFTRGLKLITEWSTHTSLVSVNVRGSLVDYAGHMYRLPESIYNILKAIEDYKNTPKQNTQEAMQAIIDLKQYLPIEDDEHIKTGDGLSYFRLVQANAFSLDIKLKEDEDVHFEPVLYSKQISERAQEGESISESECLLSKKETAVFLNEFHNNGSQVAYKVDNNIFIFPEPNLRKALDIVNEKMRASPAEKREFVRDTNRVLSERLISVDIKDSEILEELENTIDACFIESVQYSERIKTLGIWEAPKVGHLISIEKHEWIGEEFPVTIDDNRFIINSNDTKTLLKKIQTGLEEGQKTVSYNGQDIPVSPESIETISRFILESLDDEDIGPTKKDKIDKPLEETKDYFLQVIQNIDNLNYREEVNLSLQGIKAHNKPPLLKSTLHEHQKEGLAWLQQCWLSSKMAGCLLADDMGLGKTLQILTFLAWLKEYKPNLRFLVVAPTGLLKNWQQEHDIHLNNDGLGSP